MDKQSSADATFYDESLALSYAMPALIDWAKGVLKLDRVIRPVSATEVVDSNAEAKALPIQIPETKSSYTEWYEIIRYDLYDGEWFCRRCGQGGNYIFNSQAPPSKCPYCGYSARRPTSGCMAGQTYYFRAEVDIQTARGLSYARRYELDAAKEAWRIGSENGSAQSALCLGSLQLEKNDESSAEKSWKLGLSLGLPLGSPDCAFELGLLYRRQGKNQAAIQAWEKGKELGSHQAAFSLGLLYSEEGNDTDAEQAFRVALDLGHPDEKMLRNRSERSGLEVD